MSVSKGCCIYDAVDGSLRLTEQLLKRFPEVIGEALRLVQALEPSDRDLEEALILMKQYFDSTIDSVFLEFEVQTSTESDWTEIVAPGQQAIHIGDNGDEEVIVENYRYTPRGLVYILKSPLKNALSPSV